MSIAAAHGRPFDGEQQVELAEIIEHLLEWFHEDYTHLAGVYARRNFGLITLDETMSDLRRLQRRLDEATGRQS